MQSRGDDIGCFFIHERNVSEIEAKGAISFLLAIIGIFVMDV